MPVWSSGEFIDGYARVLGKGYLLWGNFSMESRVNFVLGAVFCNDLFDIRCIVSDFKMLKFLIRVNTKVCFVGKVNSIKEKNILTTVDII